MLRTKLELLAIGLVALASLAGLDAWRSSRKQQAQLQATLNEQQAVISEADKREAERHQSLNTALAEIARIKKQTHTSQQVVTELPKYIPLPQPIRFENSGASHEQVGHSDQSTTSTGLATSSIRSSHENEQISAALAGNANAKTSSSARELAEMPSSDLKPLFDFVQDCRVCQVQLQNAQKDKTDNSIEMEALSRQRDAAVKAVKGRSLLSSLRRNFIWFAVGAVVGLGASREK
jgi:hypothetical protein